MINLNPYLSFNGNCAEALSFYQYALNGTIESTQLYGDSPMEVDEKHKNLMLHAVLRFGDSKLMAADSMPDNEAMTGTNVALSLNIPDLANAQGVFNRLSEDGQVTMPFQETFWGAQFGMVTDKFGINWMVNCELEKKTGNGKQRATI